MTAAARDALEPEAEDERIARAELVALDAAVPKLVFVLDQVSRRFLKLDGPVDLFFNVTRAQLLADSLAWMHSVTGLDRAAASTFRDDLDQSGMITRILQSTGRDGVTRTLKASLIKRLTGGRALVSGSVEICPYGDSKIVPSFLNLALEGAREGIAVTDREGHYLYLNKEHVTLFGYESASELIGKSWRLLYAAEGARVIEETVFPLMRTEGRWRGRLRAKRKDGSFFSQELSLSVLANGGIVCNCRDVSTEVALVEQLARSEEMFRAFFNSLPMAVTVKKLTGERDFKNQACVTFLAQEADGSGELSGGGDLGQLEGNVFDYWRVVAQRVATTGTAETFDFPLTWGGRDVILEVKKLPLRIGCATITHVCTIFSDVTAERRSEVMSADAARRSEEYLAMQREFISMVSHEFRTPLTAIQGLQYLLLKRLSLSGETEAADLTRWLELQGQALGTLKELTDQVLLLNRIEHMDSAVPQPMEVEATLVKIVTMMSSSMEIRRTQLEVDLPKGFTAKLHEPQLRAMVENLISNALKYSTEVVTVQAGTEGNHWWLAVADRGRGIPEADQGKLFRPFYRASNIGKVSGTGLGLTIVARCAAFHGGQVALESRAGAGSKFTVTFPIKFPERSAARPATAVKDSVSPFNASKLSL